MKASATVKRSILKCSILSLISIFWSFTALDPGLAQSTNRQITLENQINPDPLLLKGISGGEIKAAEIVKTESTATGFCNGFINVQPNHTLVLSSFFEFLKIEVDSSTDTTIIIEGPGGVWCNDDSVTANPAIEGQWQPGNYKIWIGSYQENVNNSYQLKITGSN